MDHWALLYDADCGFCKTITVGLLKWERHGRLVPHSIQSDEGQALLGDLTPEQRLASVHLIAPNGERMSGGAALPPLLRLLPGGGPPAAMLARTPGLTSRTYEWVADHRVQLSKFVPGKLKRRASARLSGEPTSERASGRPRS